MKKIVILGGCGYIGSQLFSYLKMKYLVDTVDLEWFGNYINPLNIKSDFSELPIKFFTKYDVVILLAGHSTVGMCNEDIVGSFKNNVENFVTLTKKLKKQKIIYASSYRLYDGITGHPVVETENYIDPSTIYSLTKKTIDYYASLSDLEFYSLRMATVNGYSPNLRTNQVINKLYLESRDKKNISVFDEDVIFSILGINDLCRSIEEIIEGKDKRGFYNLGSFNSNVSEILKEISKNNKTIEVAYKRTPGKFHMQISTRKFEKTFSFKFTEDIHSIINSLKENISKKTHLLKSV